MELFTPAWNSKNSEKRMNAVAEIKLDKASSIEKLRKIAEQTNYEDVRQEAWKRIALEAEGYDFRNIRGEAVEKITDEITLAKVALNDGDSYVRKEAIEKVRHPLLLAKIALSEIETLAEAKQNYDTIISQLNVPYGSRLLTRDEYISRIKGSLHSDVRTAAAARIDNQAFLKEVVQQDSDRDVRKAAVEKITDPSVLKEVALKNSDSYIRKMVVEKITDLSVLKELGQKDSDRGVRRAAVEKITDQSFLKEVVQQDLDRDVRKAAVEKIIDQSFLKEVVQKDSDRDIRKAGVEKITDPSFLKEVALKDSDYNVRKAGVEKITDQSVLKEVALKDSLPYIRKAAVEKITDTSFLKEVVQKDSDSDVRRAALLSINDQKYFVDIFVNDTATLQMIAISIITDQDLLAKIIPSERIKSLISNLYSDLQKDKNVDLRKNAARNITLLAEKTPQLIKELWKDIEIKIKKTHNDKWANSHYSDCHSDAGIHTDNGGIGLSFPAYPFND